MPKIRRAAMWAVSPKKRTPMRVLAPPTNKYTYMLDNHPPSPWYCYCRSRNPRYPYCICGAGFGAPVGCGPAQAGGVGPPVGGA